MEHHIVKARKRELELVRTFRERVNQVGTGGNSITNRWNRKHKVSILRGSMVTRKYSGQRAVWWEM